MFALPSRMCLLLRKKPQSEGRRSMATLKTISIRLKSVKNIQKITKSMKMVSAAKYSRAERELKQAKPLGEGIKTFYTNAAIQPEELPEGQVHKQLYIAVTSDRGLCGAVHTSIAKMIRKMVGEPTENIKVVCIGDKAKALLQKFFKGNILFVCHEVGRLPATFQDASLIVKHIMESEFQYHMAKIVYNRFRSVVSYVTEDLTFFSVNTVLESPSIQAYEDADEETVTSFVEFTMAALIYYALKESSCSEQSSRMTAMDNASKNAGEMISKLTLTFNRTRQAVITRELIEIISGASAL